MKHMLTFVALLLTSLYACTDTRPQQKLVAQTCCSDKAEGRRACSGDKNCTACKNCSGCKHCSKNGGTCGVCK